MEKGFKVKYQDRVLLPVLILVMNTVNLYIAHPHTFLSAGFFRSLAEDTVVVAVCWLAMRRLIQKLDERYSFQQGFLKRIVLQLVFTLLLTCGLLLAITWLAENYLYKRSVPQAVYTHHIWVYAFWILIQNGIYITMYMLQWSAYLQAQKMPAATAPAIAPVFAHDKKLAIKLGNKNIFVDALTIQYCTTFDDFSKIYTDSNETFLIEKTLQEMVSILPAHLFFRANRQYILHRDMITGTERIENGKLKLILKPCPELPTAITVSRAKAPELKEWLRMAVA
ncbi:LytTR family transcriptional regulator [Mucilaginibacter sp. Bleaf8]|uniref:LytR/AlgR family response regulator transcription factor n=1 Tax=Mucilaginibacter sp. Bleaf8 TaxID=2834430 RepID=UPI001BCD8F94|nr:LytTR family DNA-binding domain-containing protein [Mucilaginibacter sp. Bleaf8]MBS7565809.1 LytTR family transcriptional regulator [Mucilaginibacter sp. Bleaf8]